MKLLSKLKDEIAETVRRQRRERHWSQQELAERLGISQPHLSKLERGSGSFTAEQLLHMAQLFNVSPTDFTNTKPGDERAGLQNSLARYGATHLRESENTLPTDRRLLEVVGDTLASGESRLITALAPVLVKNIDKLNLSLLRLRLVEAGLERRLGWLIENVLIALRTELAKSLDRESSKRYRRAVAVLELEATAGNVDPKPPILLDPQIRSPKTRDEVFSAASEPSRRWAIVTRLHPSDFARALELARVG